MEKTSLNAEISDTKKNHFTKYTLKIVDSKLKILNALL